MKTLCYALLCLSMLPASVYAQDTPTSGEDPAMEARMREAWTEIHEHAWLRSAGTATEADDPQQTFADEFFRYYREHPDTPTGKKAGQAAFVMWGNKGAADRVDDAIQHVPPSSELWAIIINMAGNAYFRSGRGEDYLPLLLRLEDELTHPKGRSELMLTLARHYTQEQPEKAKAYYEEVVTLGVHPFDVQKAESALYEMASLNVGQSAPDFTAETIDGKPVTLSDLRGKVVLLEFWATSCGPCLPEIPHMKALKEELPASDFEIIGVTQDEDLEMLRQFLEENGMTWTQIQQGAEFEGEILKMDEVPERYNVFAIPRSFLIDREGNIAVKDLRGEKLKDAVHNLVAESGS